MGSPFQSTHARELRHRQRVFLPQAVTFQSTHARELRLSFATNIVHDILILCVFRLILPLS